MQICAKHHASLQQVFERSRLTTAVRAREACIAELRFSGFSSSEIGFLMGGLNHVSVILALRRADAKLREARDEPGKGGKE